MASLRNIAINIIRRLGFRYIPQGIRHFSARMEDVLTVLGA
jgi:hypothetical protein